ncbi:MAG: 2-C-methyl-D-erythritol 4-phosphate cytidylyltransferase, partial [Verrucomicrobiota bacterium]
RVDGGQERQHSVEAGLAALKESDEFVAVHDGARPLVTAAMIELCLEQAREVDAATLARPVTETIKRADENDFSCDGIDRSSLWFTETPQIFRSAVLKKAYAEISARGDFATDEVSALEAIGVATKLVASPGPNLKITHPPDIRLAEALLS